MQENLSNSDSGYFITFPEKNQLIMAYVENQSDVKIFDVFKKKVINRVNDLNHTEKIVCVDYFIVNQEERYLITIALDNKMIISNLTINEKNTSKTIEKIGDNFKAENKNNNHFSLSTVRHERDIWIITSFNYDQHFKIFNDRGELKHKVSYGQNIISLQGLFYTEENTFICVRTNKSIGLFINEFLIRRFEIPNKNQDKYINFKLINDSNLILENNYYLLISAIDKNLNYYTIDIFNISFIFPLFTKLFNNFLSRFTFGQSLNREVHIPMNEEIRNKIKNNEPIKLNAFQIGLENKAIKDRIKKSLENNLIEQYNIGNILFWEGKYIIVGTPFDYLDILDCQDKVRVGKINNNEKSENSNQKEDNDDNLPIISYNISERIDDPDYDKCFIMRDNKGKIQYIRPAVIEDKLNYKILKSEEYFNELPESEKLLHIRFSMIFYCLYCLFSYLLPLITAFVGKNKYDPEKQLSNSLYVAAFVMYIIYAFFGIWFKGCVYNIDDEYHTKRTCTKIMIALNLILKIIANCFVTHRYCEGNKNGVILVLMIFIIFMVHSLTNCCIYANKIEFILKKYWLNFLFYQISRFLILIFFIVCILLDVNKIEIYIYALILCVILIYIHFANYFNTLFKDIVYSNYFQAIFNYPFEWMNLFCCFCKDPKDCIEDIDRKFCLCDSFFLRLFQYLILLILILIYIMIIITIAFYTYLFCGCFKSKSDD